MTDIAIVTDFPYQISVVEDARIPMPDGTILSARLWLPIDAETNPVPLILEHLPYRKRDGTVMRDQLTHPYFAGHGYACLRVDMRGNGDSQGLMHDEYTAQELDDAAAVIAWARAQPWCSGAAGMMGISWGGFNALQVAARAPDTLGAIVTLCSTVDRYADDIHYKGGCLLNENLGWAGTMLSYSSRPPDPALVGDAWRDMWLERLHGQPNLAETWLRHQRRDAYWQHGSVCEDFSAIKAKVLAIGGWGDAYKNAVPQLVQALPGAKGIIGPWVHKYPHFAVPGPRIGFLQETLRWWDRWLKGLDTGVEADPDLRLYQMDSTRPKAWYLHREGQWIAHQAAAPVVLNLQSDRRLGQGVQDLDVVVRSAQDCGGDAGEYCAIWLGPELPGDQRRDDAMSVCFDSAPLAEPMSLVGAPAVKLTLRSDQSFGQIAVRLCEVFADGASARLSYGVLNLTHRNSHATPQPLSPGEAVSVTVHLDHMACKVAAGNQLRVAISTAYWPLIWPMPGQGAVHILAGQITLPSAATLDQSVNFAPPEGAKPWQHREIRPASHKRDRIVDDETGIVSLMIEDDFGAHEDEDHGLITGSIARERWDIHPDDPLLAHGHTHWTQNLARGDWSVRTEAVQDMWSDATHFHQTASVHAYEGEKLVFEKRWSATVPRDQL